MNFIPVISECVTEEAGLRVIREAGRIGVVKGARRGVPRQVDGEEAEHGRPRGLAFESNRVRVGRELAGGGSGGGDVAAGLGEDASARR